MNSIIRSGSYNIYVGSGSLLQAEKFISGNIRFAEAKKIILVDDHTDVLCLPHLREEVPSLRQAMIIQIASGESGKSIDSITRLWSILTDEGITRNSLLINLGGGVVCDVGGFAAATYMRGIQFINIPTTLLSMVDASAGGKNGINFGGYKNQVGTFYDPVAVFISEDFLKTLPGDEMRSGFAEVMKHALISDRSNWSQVCQVTQLSSVNWFEIIKGSVQTKNKIVSSDYRDRNSRKVLNFGHTIGHALESYSGINHAIPLKHGEAIAIGMIGELFLSEKCCGLDRKVADEIIQFIRMHFSAPIQFQNDDLLGLMKGDKKNNAGRINFSLLRSIGDPVINQHAGEDLILQALDFCREQMTIPVN